MGNRNLLVVEGADCMGKTTLVGQLQEALKWPSVHTGGPKTDEQLEEAFGRLEAIQKLGPRTIIDRAPMLSEIAYRPVSSGERVTPENRLSYVARLSELNPVVVVCRRRELPDLKVVERPHKSLEYWAKVIGGYEGIVARYDDLIYLLSKQGVPVYVYDWTLEGEWDNLQAWLNFYLFPKAEG
jgi:hypothetical protein